jgi:hypothetical protein
MHVMRTQEHNIADSQRLFPFEGHSAYSFIG